MTHTEYTLYSRDGIEEILRNCAVLKLIGNMYVGKIGKQEVRWLEDGSVEVLTHHVPGTLPPATEQPPRKKRRYQRKAAHKQEGSQAEFDRYIAGDRR